MYTPVHICSSAPQKKIKWSQKNWYACDADNIYHSAEWLHYEYLQMGKFNKAAKLVKEMAQVVNIEAEPFYKYWLYRTQARQIIYTKDWKPLADLPEPITTNNGDVYWAAYSEGGLLLADGLRAIHNQQLLLISLINNRFVEILKILEKRTEGGFKDACQLMYQEFLSANEMIIHNNKKKSLMYLNQALQIQKKIDSSQQSLTLPFISAQEFYATLNINHPILSKLRQQHGKYTQLKGNIEPVQDELDGDL